MRIRQAAASTALIVALAACSSPQVEVPRATVKEAPVVAATDPPVTEPDAPQTTVSPTTSPWTTAASSTVRPNVPASRVEPSNAFVPKTDDEIAIAYIVSEYQRRAITEAVERTFNADALLDIETGRAHQATIQNFEQKQRDGHYSKWGSVQQSVPFLVKVAGNRAIAVVCERNDVQVWDTRMTDTEADDILLNDSLGSVRLSYTLLKRGEKWFISESAAEGDLGACQSVF
jgi:hypothetical protein